VSDITPLAGLRSLRYLNLCYTQVTNISPLEGLALECIYLGSTLVSNFNPLTSLTHLQDLDLSKTLIEDLTPLVSLSSLQFLDLYRTKVTDLGPLSALMCLRSLNVRDTMVNDYSPLRNLNLFFLDKVVGS